MFEDSLIPSEVTKSAKDLFLLYYGKLCVFAKHLLGDGEQAEDVVQDVFVKLCEQPEMFPDKQVEAKRYLYVAVRNECYKVLRHEKVVSEYHYRNDIKESTEPEIINNIIHAEVMGELNKAIEALPQGCALILKKGIFDGMSNQMIANELNLSINTVKSQKQRAISLLKARLSPDMQPFLVVFLIYMID
ncbi:RNA polymerase sigma-70 factor, ECF subfamily [Parapedobacter composti]|uniref:RNA polymerase sigma-70 factor, ECF subfamily n=1 Tax=Parapedobacter composti TaxID=623281 RepID=A0A1I1J5L8_9SPHI|nr:RNA polymerase sigma-70 factor [Parapedobacter composti]SFC43857.1 RNA polymerase sigma-70 factor, ECF subfamily [Parapedobacter composti]